MIPFTLQTDRLTPVAEADRPELHALFTDSDVRRYLLDDLIVEETWTADVVEKSIAMFRDLDYGLWAVRETGQRPIIGVCGYWRFEHLINEFNYFTGSLPRQYVN